MILAHHMGEQLVPTLLAGGAERGVDAAPRLAGLAQRPRRPAVETMRAVKVSTARSAAEEALLDAAERVLVDAGYAAITTRRLAEEAGVNHGLVHYYFGSVENLLVRTLERFTERLVARQREMYAADMPFLEKWRTAMRYIVSEDVAYQKVWFELQALAWNRPELQERVDHVNAEWRAVLPEAFAEPREHYGIEMPLEALVSLVITFNEGIMLERLSGVTERPRGATRLDRRMAVELTTACTRADAGPLPGRAEGYVERDGVRVFYEVYGEGEPTVLLLPTWSLIHSRHWKMQIPYLARHCRVVTFDGRGNGRSDRPVGAEAYAMREFALDALAVLDATATETRGRGRRLVRRALGRLARGRAPGARRRRRVHRPGGGAGAAATGARGVLLSTNRSTPTKGWAKYNIHYWLRDYRDFLEFFLAKCFTEPHSTKQIEDGVAWALETTPESARRPRRGDRLADRRRVQPISVRASAARCSSCRERRRDPAQARGGARRSDGRRVRLARRLGARPPRPRSGQGQSAASGLRTPEQNKQLALNDPAFEGGAPRPRRAPSGWSLADRQRLAGAPEPVVEARDLPDDGASGRRLAGGIRRVVPAVPVRARRAERPSGENRTGRELERASVPEAARPDRVAEVLGDAAAAVDDDDRVPLVRGDPDVAGTVECDPVGAVQSRMLHEERVQAERAGDERRVAAGRCHDVAVLAQVDSPKRASGGVGDQERAVLGERQAVRDDPLGGRRERRLQALVLAADADRVGHRGYAEEHRCRAARGADAEDASLGSAAVGHVQVAVVVEGDAVGPGRPRCEACRDWRARRVGGVTTPISSPAAPKPVR